MIDCENEVYTRVAQVLREKFPGIDVASEYVSCLKCGGFFKFNTL